MKKRADRISVHDKIILDHTMFEVVERFDDKQGVFLIMQDGHKDIVEIQLKPDEKIRWLGGIDMKVKKWWLQAGHIWKRSQGGPDPVFIRKHIRREFEVDVKIVSSDTDVQADAQRLVMVSGHLPVKKMKAIRKWLGGA